jgi:hypothetical protein
MGGVRSRCRLTDFGNCADDGDQHEDEEPVSSASKGQTANGTDAAAAAEAAGLADQQLSKKACSFTPDQ